jgi:hypothetical protein
VIGQKNDVFAELDAKGLVKGLGVHYDTMSGEKII